MPTLARPRVRLALWGALFAALTTACGGPRVPLTGTITDAYTGKPVQSALVKAGGSEYTTDVGGTYQLTQWSPRATLEVSAQGYEPVSITLESQAQLANPEPPAATFDTTLRPNTISGVITDRFSHQPLAGVQIRVSDTLSATTDATGRYTLQGVPESFTLQVSAPDYAQVSETVHRQIAFDTVLRPNVLTGEVVDSYTNAPLAGASVKAGSASAETDAQGRYRLEGLPEDATVEITAPGYATLSQPVEQSTTIDAALRPDVLKGVLVDQTTGDPIPNAAIVAASALNSTDVAFARITNSRDGAFTLEGVPEQGFVQVLAPGYRKAVFELKSGSIPPQIELEPFDAKALYITAAVGSGGLDALDEYLDLIDTSELNTLVIDLKSDLRDDLGTIYYASEVPIVKELDTARDYMDLRAILAETKRRGIYTIARVQLFSHDNMLADARPDWAIQDLEDGGPYADHPGPGIRYAWLDPWNRNVWDYNIQLGVEAAQMGFDEINFDYIRFPDTLTTLSEYNKQLGFSQPIDPVNNPEAMMQNIADFMDQARRAVNGAGAFMSVDVFGRSMLKPAVPISQNIELMAQHTDYVCPMPYPSLWWPGYLGFDNPTAHPYEVILGSLESAAPFFENKYAKLRPWLQDHTDPWQGARVVEYGPAEVRAQIQATKDFGRASGWMLYNSANVYTDAALQPE